MPQTTNTAAFRDARDLLLRLSSDHGKAVAEFTWPVFDGETFNWATDWFDVIARGNDRTALWIVEEDGAERRYSFDEMAHRSDQVATWLSGLGVGDGDRVLLMLGNQVELWESMLAIMKLGAVIMPTTTASGGADLADRVDRGEARYVIANAADTGKFESVAGDYTRICVGGDSREPTGWHRYRDAYAVATPHVFQARTAPGDTLLLYFTSGTTSRPKLVRHTQVSYPVGHLTTMYFLGLRPGDVHLNISSPGWAKHAWSSFFAPWNAEATIFIYNYSRFDAATLLDQIRRAGVTSICAPPTVWRMLIQADLSGGPGKLREALGAGEPLNPEVISQVEQAWGLTIRDGYGQTETTALVGNTPGSPIKPGSMGRPLPGVPVVLVDPVTGRPADEGEICLDLSRRPLNVTTGYLGDPERDAEVMAGGYYRTGDVATRDADGYITFVGRTDDVFKASDYRISPFELESVLIEHPAVAEAAVVPAPDPIRLAVPKAYVALAPGWEPDRETALAILRHARENLAPYQRVRRLEFYELPKTISGKIRRVELRARENAAADGASPGGEWRDDQFPELRSDR
ncbi:AMP-binding protein [Sphaerimonospora cavernae]|uniref:AMP-binding protein n=1 Tax=Sphaerimonospora cavernae TaxID=1740611 RepID=A0ABV6UA19_9ACTN